MMYQILTGAGFGIFAGYSIAACSGVLALLVLCIAAVAGYLLNMRLREYPAARLAAAFVLILSRAVLFLYPVPELLPLICGLLCGMLFYFRAGSRASLCSTAVSGVLSCSAFLLFVSGSGEACLAFICGASAFLAEFFKNDNHRKFATLAMTLLLISLFPAGAASKAERMSDVSNFVKLGKAIHGTMCLPGDGVATRFLAVGAFSEKAVAQISDFPGLEKAAAIKNYIDLYPIFKRDEKRELYPVVVVNGNGRMCRLASSLVSPSGVLIVPEKYVQELPSAFRHWSELAFAPGFIALARDFVIDCKSETIERKMQHHLEKCCMKNSVPKGVYSALFESAVKPSYGIREIDSFKQINYTLWFFGLISGLYLILRLVIFSRFDKGERRWSALENTASAVLLFMLLKRTPDTLCTALFPAAAFLMLPFLKLTGKKWRLLQLAGAVLCIISIVSAEFINAAQLAGAVCCGTMWTHLRQEKGAVLTWVDSCSLCGFALGTAIFSLLLTVNAPAVFILGLVLLLRSNALFRSL